MRRRILRPPWSQSLAPWAFKLACSKQGTGRLADKEAIVLNNWSQGKFGITLTTDAALPVSPAQIRIVNGDTVPLNTSTNADTGEVTYIGGATVAAPGNSDAITAYNTSSSIKRVEVYGLDGNDALYGGAGSDQMEGGAGDDVLMAGSGDDSLFGGAGSDNILASGGDDRVQGGRGDDWIAGLGGNDVLEGGDGKTQFGIDMREQHICFKKHSYLRNRYRGYCPIYHARKSISLGFAPSLAQSLQRATRKAVLQ